MNARGQVCVSRYEWYHTGVNILLCLERNDLYLRQSLDGNVRDLVCKKIIKRRVKHNSNQRITKTSLTFVSNSLGLLAKLLVFFHLLTLCNCFAPIVSELKNNCLEAWRKAGQCRGLPPARGTWCKPSLRRGTELCLSTQSRRSFDPYRSRRNFCAWKPRVPLPRSRNKLSKIIIRYFHHHFDCDLVFPFLYCVQNLFASVLMVISSVSRRWMQPDMSRVGLSKCSYIFHSSEVDPLCVFRWLSDIAKFAS